MGERVQGSDDLDLQLRRFERLVDVTDPQQRQLLERMRAATLRVQQARGEWDRPSTDRLWNVPVEPEKATAPLALGSSYRDYVEWRSKTGGATRLEAVHGTGVSPLALPAATNDDSQGKR